MKRTMVDLETYSTEPDGLILSIGAKEFDPALERTGWVGREFYTAVSVEKQVQKWGRVISPSTLKWWEQQTPEARRVLEEVKTAPYLDTALGKFSEWLGGVDTEIWGLGAMMDNLLLTTAYKACGIPRPWGYRSDMCFRTLRTLCSGVAVPAREGTFHNALDDARYQAQCAVIYLNHLGIK